MDIYSKKGTKVIVTKETIKNGYDYVEEHAKKHLKIGEQYTIEKTVVSGWSTEVYLQEFPNERFNSVTFKNVKKNG